MLTYNKQIYAQKHKNAYKEKLFTRLRSFVNINRGEAGKSENPKHKAVTVIKK